MSPVTDDVPLLGLWHQHPHPHLVIPPTSLTLVAELTAAGLCDLPVHLDACPHGCVDDPASEAVA